VAYEFRLPDIGEGLTEAEIVRWLIAVGHEVKVDQPVVEVETDKAVVEIPSPRSGTVLHHGASGGETLAVGEILVVIGDAGEVWPPTAEQAESPPSAPPIVGTISEAAEELTPRSHKTQEALTRVQALPLVRKLAAEMGVDLNRLSGTGPGGRISREDVLAAADPAATVPEPTTINLPPVSLSVEGERRPLSRLRRTIAANMSRSWAEIPHVTTFDEVDASRLLAARRALESRHQVKLPIEALMIKAVLPALRAFPEFNASLDGDDLVVKGRYDIGVAVDTPEGLMVAVVAEADRQSLLEVAADVQRLANGAKERTLEVSELTGQGFTISNIGALGGGFGTPIVPPGTTAILSVGRANERPVAVGGKVEIVPVMPLSLSYDHRVIDGGLGRRFMAMVIENVAEPALFLA
jgi:pyruvate dehydrogenase E2 component (dihydrolipoamide acetyltransferase)